jgi:hypothetical protein
MKNKVLSILIITFSIGLWETCCSPEEFTMAYTGIDLDIRETTIEANEVFEFRLLPQDSIIGMNINTNQFFITEAYGINCDDYKYIRTSEIISLNIKSLYDFNNNFLANSYLNEIIEVHRIDGVGGNLPVITLNKFIEEISSEDFNRSKSAAIFNATYKIPLRPTLDSTHVFIIEMETNDFNIFKDQSQEITWK